MTQFLGILREFFVRGVTFKLILNDKGTLGSFNPLFIFSYVLIALAGIFFGDP